jgi:alkylation response protein AidB-like acyl-CoA dehydrogenase
MVSAQGNSIRKEVPTDATPTIFDKAKRLASEFAARAALHDRDASFPFENFDQLAEAGLLALTVPTALGGSGAGALDAARIIGIFGKADPSTALVLSMHYIQHLDGEEHALAGPARPQAGPRNRRRRGPDQRLAGRAGSRVAVARRFAGDDRAEDRYRMAA